ncbi:endothelin-converting enzyme 1 isoform X6 [Rhipicephalus sanguineus]|uniref:endothelin-converting enzyme 1 isoform X6 n=1 Tax=Rhipicephalus sanguineus TaxID=34632 RepID=UPI0020C3CA97|nr:endothelin-converting enzyme 1 isoform X6 [Rhipicephalus sanguineus]
MLQHDTKIHIAEPAYVENVFALLRRTRRYQVKNYVGWKIIATLAPFVSALRGHHHKFMAQYGFYEKRKQDICMESIAVKASSMRHLVSKIYVERKFSLEAKKNVQLMSELIQRELGTSLSNLRWRTHQARKTALKAVTEMAKLIGYPDWMDNDDTLAGLFSNVRNFTEQSPFVNVYEEYRMASFHDLMKKLSTPYSTSDEWSGAPTDVTFGYDASTNMIYVPAGVLQPPLYSLNYPRAVNWGTVGVMIAREMARVLHAPDLQSVSDKSRCTKITIEEYYEINPLCRRVPHRDGDDFSFDEEPFLEDYEDLEEEILDEIALTVTWKAFLNHSKHSRGDRSSEDIEGGSRQTKLFFVSAGVLLCTMLTQYDIRQCETGCTTDCRINVLTKIPEFREAFQCNGV